MQCMIVDDAEIIRKVAHRILERLGHTVVEADGGKSALELVKRSEIDLILLDWHMPDLSGHEVLKALRGMKGVHQPLVVYCTTENDPVDIARAMALGAHDYLLKPYDRQSLEDKLDAFAGLV